MRPLPRYLAAGLVPLLLLALCGDARGQEKAEGPTQATIEIVVIEYSSDTLFDLGTSGVFRRFDAGPGRTGPGILSLADLAFPSLDTSGLGLAMFLDKIALGEGEFEFLIQALEQDERVEILSNPRLLLEKGAEIEPIVETVIEVPYETNKVVGTTTVTPTEFKNAGVTLQATLEEIHGDYVALKVTAKVAAVGPRLRIAVASQPEGSVLEVPEFFNRSVTTEVVVGDRQVLVLGALLSKEKTTSRRSVPILGEIPLLKYLFSSYRNQEKYRELIFFVKPIIHRGGYVPRPPFSERELNAK